MVADMNLGMKCIKYMLLTVNAMFVLTATLILSIGTTIYAIYHDFRHFISDGYFSPAALLIAIGVIMLFISLFGCLGAAKESTCMINTFALLLSIVFILEVAAGLAAYSSLGSVNRIVTENFNASMQVYHKDKELNAAIDAVQEQLTCCGIHEKDDWELTPWHETNTNNTRPYPDSCYPRSEKEESEIEAYENGCIQRLAYIIAQSAVLLGTGAMTIAFIQLVGIIFSVMLGKAIRQAKTVREQRRWEIREQMINAYSQMEPHKEKKNENPTPVIYVPTIGHSQA